MERFLFKLIKTSFLSGMAVLLPVIAKAANTVTVYDNQGRYFKLDLSAKTAKITRPSRGYYSGNVSFPGLVIYKGDSCKVTSIDNYAFCKYDINAAKNEEIISVTLPNTLKTIGYGAFWNCQKLQSVNIPESVTTIEAISFLNCVSLTSIVLPEGLNSMGYQAFYQCSGLKSVTIPSTLGTISQEAFYKCTGLTSLVLPEGVTNLNTDAFFGCSGLTSVSLPQSLTFIGIRAFQNCSAITSITIPSGVTTIESYAFSLCTSLTTAIVKASPSKLNYYFDNTVQEITFDCDSVTPMSPKKIEKVILTDKVRVIGQEAFKERTNLTAEGIQFGKGLKYIDYRAFYNCSAIKSIVLPEGVEIISRAFDSCYSLESVTIPKSLKGCYDAFAYCNKLTAIHISDLAAWCAMKLDGSILSDTRHLYLNGEQIVNMKIPDGVTSIGDYVFYGMRQLEAVDIPRSVTSIGSYAFRGCTNLKTVFCFADSLPSTGTETFAYIGTSYRSSPFDATLYVHQSVRDLYANTVPWSYFNSIKGVIDSAPTKCATPTISYEDGKLKFDSATKGVTFVSEIWPIDEKGNIGNGTPEDYSTERIGLKPRYKVTVYCKAEACKDSEKAVAILDWSDGKPKITYLR